MMRARIEGIQPNDFANWEELSIRESTDIFDYFGWFSVRIGAVAVEGTNDFQVCVSTPKAFGRAKQSGNLPGIVVERFDEAGVTTAIYDRVESIEEQYWHQIVDKLRVFMLWEYEGMSGGSGTRG